MKICVEQLDEAYVVKASGRDCSRENIEELKDAFEQGIQLDSSIPLVLDVGQLNYLGSEAVGIIAGVHRRLQDNGRQLIVRNPTEAVRRVFMVTRLDHFLLIQHDRPEQ